MMEYLSTAKVGGDPDAVSEVLHVILLPWFGAKGSSCSAPDKDAATEAYRSELLSRMVKQFGRLRGRRMSAKIALSRRMEPLQTEADRNSGLKHHTLRNWALSGA